MANDWEYRQKTPRSKRLYERAQKVFAGGISHNTRYYDPYPLFVKKGKGKYIWDEDGNKYTDYWMGHSALILGHSPKVVADRVAEQLKRGTHYGMGSTLSVQLGEEVQRSVPCAELVRFCNTGAEATMYLVRLARAHTHKRIVVKISGGWHGYNTQLNKGVQSPFAKSESAGILEEEQSHVLTVPFNDAIAADRLLKENKDDVAVFFLEPVLGAGGCIPADPEYLRALRELTTRYGALLAFDEIITGFRLALGGAQEYYGVKPELASLGKIVGGGLPIGLVCGEKEIMSRADPRIRDRDKFVSIGGGTFSENPMTMAAGLATLRYLRKNQDAVYHTLSKLGEELRSGVDKGFQEESVDAHTAGVGSLFLTHFTEALPRDAAQSAEGDHERSRRYALGLMANGIFALPEHLRAISTYHAARDVARYIKTTSSLAGQLRKD